MRRIQAEEWEILSFFEVEPTTSEPNEHWLFRDNTYTVRRGELELVCAIHPYHRDVELIIKLYGSELYRLSVLGLHDIYYERDEIGELLRFRLRVAEDVEDFVLRVKPEINLYQYIENEL